MVVCILGNALVVKFLTYRINVASGHSRPMCLPIRYLNLFHL